MSIMVMMTRPVLSLFCYAPSMDFGDEAPAQDPLGLLRSEFSGFAETVDGKRVLDFGCGFGHQSAALAQLGAVVTGLETNRKTLERARQLYPNVTFTDHIPDGSFDYVISQNAMEHYHDPKAVLLAMKRALAPGGALLITFGPPWYAPWGAHCAYFCKLPWVQLLFPEATVMAIRSRYRSDGAKRYTEVESGLNMMSLRKWERLVADSGLRVQMLKYHGVKNLAFLTRIPLVRELFTRHVTAALR